MSARNDGRINAYKHEFLVIVDGDGKEANRIHELVQEYCIDGGLRYKSKTDKRGRGWRSWRFKGAPVPGTAVTDCPDFIEIRNFLESDEVGYQGRPMANGYFFLKKPQVVDVAVEKATE